MGEHKDRHENIGYGTLGFKTLCQWANHPKLAKIPKILETPWWDGEPMYKYEINILKAQKWEDYRK
jgi:deoxyribonuclease-4